MNDVVLKAISKLTDRFEKLETQVNSISSHTSSSTAGEVEKSRYANKRFIKCATCEEKRIFCTHCSSCGKGGHKRRDCTVVEKKE